MRTANEVTIVCPAGDPDHDSSLLAGIRAYLGRHEAINTIQLAGFLASDTFDPSTPVFVAMAGDRIVAVTTLAPGFNLLISHVEDHGAIEALAAKIARRAIEPPGVMGRSADSLDFAEHWQRFGCGSYAPGMVQRILAATMVQAPQGVSGNWRHMTDDDHPMLIEWFTDFGVESDHMTAAVARRHAHSMMQRLDERSGGTIWVDEAGVPVSVARYKAPTFTGIRIGPVYTLPAHRRRGYGGAVTAAATQLLLDQGYAFVCLYTNALNPTSNHIYEAIGYTFIADSMQYRFSARAAR
ncbi:MAG: GNAT family N-acetyltransferase [Chloroflexia bacterium]|nr:GNAT family N-acetyltransferase [Chloroflexia bacterium]